MPAVQIIIVSILISSLLSVGMGVLFLSLYNIHQPALPPTGNVPALQEEKSPGEVRAHPVLFLCMIRVLLGMRLKDFTM